MPTSSAVGLRFKTWEYLEISSAHDIEFCARLSDYRYSEVLNRSSKKGGWQRHTPIVFTIKIFIVLKYSRFYTSDVIVVPFTKFSNACAMVQIGNFLNRLYRWELYSFYVHRSKRLAIRRLICKPFACR